MDRERGEGGGEVSAPLIDRQQIATRHGLSYRYVRDTLTKRPDFPAPAQRLSQRLVRWNARDVERFMARTAQQ